MSQMGFPAKILLFGEYSVLQGSNALCIPFSKFSGRFSDACSSQNHPSTIQQSQIFLTELYYYLNQLPDNELNRYEINLFDFQKDLISGIYFDSSIPRNYGLGSSASLTAAVFDRYSKAKDLPLPVLRRGLATIESFFHGSSSGIDPLVSYLREPLLLTALDENDDSQILRISLDNSSIMTSISVFLIDSNESGDTKAGISKTESLPREYLNHNDQTITLALQAQKDAFFEALTALSIQQFALFNHLFPQAIKQLHQMGISTKQFSIKLCGSGGGGYYLAFTAQPDRVESACKKLGLKTILIDL